MNQRELQSLIIGFLEQNSSDYNIKEVISKDGFIEIHIELNGEVYNTPLIYSNHIDNYDNKITYQLWINRNVTTKL